MFEFSDPRCTKMDLEVLDSDKNVTKDLIATVNVTMNGTHVLVSPKDPMD